MKLAACGVAALLLVVTSPLRADRVQPIPAAASSFVGTTPCGEIARAFVGGLAADAGCHAITWQLTLDDSPSAPSWKLNALYNVPSPGNPNAAVDGPRVELSGTLQVTKGIRTHPAAPVYHLNLAKPQPSLSFVKLADGLLHFVSADGGLMVGTSGWSYTLNAAALVERPGPPGTPSDVSYKILPFSAGANVFGVFEGRTPCTRIAEALAKSPAGCIKLKWLVTLFKDPATSVPTTYRAEGTLQRQNMRQGTWRIVRGTPADPNATVYQLDGSGSEPPMMLLKADENVLLFLDRGKQPLIGNLDFSYTLNRIVKPDAGGQQ